MIFEQKDAHTRTRFTFRERDFKFMILEQAESVERIISYDDIAFVDPHTIQRQGIVWMNIAAMLFGFVMYAMFVAIFMEFLTRRAVIDHEGLIFFVLCYPYAVITYFTRHYLYLNDTYTIYTTSKQNIVVLHDKQKDTIIAELEKRSKAYMKDRYATLNIMGDLGAELDKFNHLKKMEIIDEQEYKVAFERMKPIIREGNLGISLNSSLDDEINRFTYLKDNEIITEQEFIKAMEDLAAHYKPLDKSEIKQKILH